MSKYMDGFVDNYKTTKKVREVTEHLKKIEKDKKMDKLLSEVIAGKWIRKYR